MPLESTLVKLARGHGAGGIAPEALETLRETIQLQASRIVDEALVDVDARGGKELEARDLQHALKHHK